MALSLESYTVKHIKPNVVILTKYNNVSLCISYCVLVPMDLDVKIKGVILGACFLIVSTNT